MSDDTTIKRSFFVRRFDAGDLLDVFLLTAVVTLLVIRTVLAATGYPEVGGGTLHIAHMLWGGLGMMAALVLIFSLQGRLWLFVAAAGGGAGFGTFIDELGKFITQDNNYFFQPTIALIYLIFVAMYLLFRSVGKFKKMTSQERLVNAIDITKEAVLLDLSTKERDKAMEMLAGCDQADPTVHAFQALLHGAETAIERAPGRMARLALWMQVTYFRIIRRRWFRGLFVGLFVVVGLLALVASLIAIAGLTLGGLAGGWAALSDSEFAAIGSLAATIAYGTLTLIGVIRWGHGRLAAYRWFLRAVLVQVFIGQFFQFYDSQLSAMTGLIVLLVIWACLRLMISEEQARLAHAETS